MTWRRTSSAHIQHQPSGALIRRGKGEGYRYSVWVPAGERWKNIGRFRDADAAKLAVDRHMAEQATGERKHGA